MSMGYIVPYAIHANLLYKIHPNAPKIIVFSILLPNFDILSPVAMGHLEFNQSQASQDNRAMKIELSTSRSESNDLFVLTDALFNIALALACSILSKCS